MHPKDVLASIYRRSLHVVHAPQPEPPILVLIPLVGRAQAESWATVNAMLFDTLDALRRQEYENMAVLLACQDRPEAFAPGPRHHFVPAPPYARAGRLSDHHVKMRGLAQYAARHFHGFAYVMPLDGDDLPHPRLFAHVAADNNGDGYLIDKGYMMAARSGRLAPLFEAEGTSPFWHYCGSCALMAVDFTRQWLPGAYLRIIGKGHRNYVARTRRLGHPLVPVPFPAMIYRVDHGDNMQQKRGKGAGKLRYLERNEITDPDRRAAIRRDFGLS